MIRDDAAGDAAAVRIVNEEAFGSPLEAAIVDAAGTKRLRDAGAPFVIVLGHPEYYPRFGFEPAARHGVRCQWPDVPDNAFMLLVLDPEREASLAGTARYRSEFDAAV